MSVCSGGDCGPGSIFNLSFPNSTMIQQLRCAGPSSTEEFIRSPCAREGRVCDRIQATALGVQVPGWPHVPGRGRVRHWMQLHRQLPELREGGAGRGEDLPNLGAEQHYGGPAARRPTPASHQPAPRPARTSREPGRGPTLPWPPGSAVREGGRTLVDADVMAPRTSSRRRSAAAATTRAGNHGEPGGRPLWLPRRKSRPPRRRLADTRPPSPPPPVTPVASLRGERRDGRRRLTSGWLHSTSVGGTGLLEEARLKSFQPGPAPSLKAQTPSSGEPLLFFFLLWFRIGRGQYRPPPGFAGSGMRSCRG